MQSESEKFVVCDVCGCTEAKSRYTSRTYGKGEDLLVLSKRLTVLSAIAKK